jgi:hypothetical protein
VDTSRARVESGWLTTRKTVLALDTYRPRALVWWWTIRFGQLKGLQDAVNRRYVVAQRYRAVEHQDPDDPDAALYLRRADGGRGGS